MSLGMYDAKEKSSLNISEIMKENEKTKHTRSGKKNFRKVDKEISTKRDSSSEEYISIDEQDNQEQDSEEKYSQEQDSEEKDSQLESKNDEDHVSDMDSEDKLSDHLENNFYESLRVKVNIIMINPDERIRRQNVNRFLLETVDIGSLEWEKFNYKKIVFKKPFESLNPGQWLDSFLLDNAVEALINKYKLSELVCFLNTNTLEMISKNSTESCFRFV
jgi:hypothetical protein